MIDPHLAEFLQEGVGIHIGTRNERLEPNGARASAVRVEEGGTHLVVYVSELASRRVMPDLEANGHAAVVFGRPEDDRSCQVKGRYVSSRPGVPDDRPIVAAQWEGFLDQLELIGIPRALVRGWIYWPVVAIRLEVTELYNQTPGPDAGAAIR